MNEFQEGPDSTPLSTLKFTEYLPGRAEEDARKKRYKVFLILASVLILVVGVFRVSARYSSVGSAPRISAISSSRISAISPSRILAISSNRSIGINYYHESMGYLKQTDIDIDNDLSLIQQVTNKVKVYHNPYTNAGQVTAADSLKIVKDIVQKAKARKMYVVWTENDDSVTLTGANWSDYASRVIADAAEAYSVGADEFLVGNEISLHNNGDPGYNDTNLPARIKQLVISCRSSFPGIKGYEDGWYKSDSWHEATLGPLDKIYFTLYEPWYNFKAASDRIAAYFGKTAEIGELSTMSTKSELHYKEDDWTRELMRRYDYVQQKGLTMWLFTLRETQNDSFGLFQFSPPNQYHDIWNYLRGNEALTYHELLSNNFDDGTTQAFSGNGYNYGGRLRVGSFGQEIANVSSSDYVFRGSASPISISGPEAWRAMRLVFRYSDTNNYYFLDIEPINNRVQLFRRLDGVDTPLGGALTSLHLGSTYDFEIRVSGQALATRIQIFWDTMKIIDMADTRYRDLDSGGFGMKNSGVTGDIGDVVVTDFEDAITKSTLAH